MSCCSASRDSKSGKTLVLSTALYVGDQMFSFSNTCPLLKPHILKKNLQFPPLPSEQLLQGAHNLLRINKLQRRLT